MINIKLFFLLLALSCFPLTAFTQSPIEYTGQNIRVLSNNKDIYNPKNDFIREEMKEKAAFDAIEKGAFTKIRGGNLLFKEAFSKNETESNFENHISELLRRYHLRWRRTSDYEFKLEDKKKWRVTVTGIVEADSTVSEKDKINWRNLPTYKGKSIKVINNKLDIYHTKNDIVRNQMKQAAIFDAIEKGAVVSVDGNQTSILNSVALGDKENLSSDQISQMLEKYHIVWKRTSDYIFEKVGKRKWIAKVNGIVYNEISTNPKQEADDYFTSKKTFIVENKNYNKVQVNIARKDVEYGQKQLILYRTIQRRKASGGVSTIRKPKAFLYITHQGDYIADARIIKGFWNVKVRDVVEIEYYNKKIKGVRYEFALPYNTLINLSKNNPLDSVSIFSNGISYITENRITRLGFILGYRNTAITIPNKKSVFLHTFSLGFNYHIGIIPNILYLYPEANLGYVKASDNISSNEISLAEKDNNYWTANTKLSLAFRLSIVDFLVGCAYENIFTSEGINGLYPFLGLKVHISKHK